jgi:ABC-type glycerol-3-phosphate transport system substrate-binding protein
VFQCSVSWAQGLYDRGILRELNDFVARTPELQDDQFMPSALYHSRKNGRIYGIPHIVDAGCLLWNLDMLRADPELHGMFETNPDGTPDFTRIRFDAVKDWDDFRRIATRLTRMRSQAEAVELGAAARNLQQYGFQINAYGGGAGLFIRWIPSNGVKFQDATGTRALFDTPGTVETLNFLAGLYYDAKVCPKFSRDLTSHGRFEERSVACAPGGTWDGKYIVRDTEGWMGFGMTAYPPGPSGPGYKTLTWANMMAMSARTKIPDVAWDYIRLNCSLEGALLKLKYLNQNSPRLDFYAGDAWADEIRNRPYLSNIKRICESGDPLLHTQTQAALDEVLPIVEYLLLNWPDMQAGKGAYASAAEAVHTAAQRVDEVYTRYGKLVQGWQRPSDDPAETEGR